MPKRATAKEARIRWKALLDQVEAGQEVTIVRHGKTIARLVPPARKARRLPSLRDFRASIRFNGRPLSDSVLANRDEERS